MNETLFVVLLGTLGFASTCIGLWKDYRDKRYTKRWFRGLKKEFFVLLGIGLSILILSIWQYLHTKNENERDKRIAAEEQKKNDSLMQNEIVKGIDSGIQQLTQGFAKSFNEQYIKMDTLNFTLTKIKDSVNANKILAPEESPTILMLSNAITLDSITVRPRKLKLTFTSADAGSANLDIRGSLMVLYENGELIEELHDNILIDKSDRIPQNATSTVDFSVNYDAVIKKIYVHVKGSYTNLNGKNRTPIDVLYEFDTESKKTIKMFDAKKGEILNKATRR